MKKTLIVLSILFASLIVWSLLTASAGEYRKTKNPGFSFETIIINSPDPERLSVFYKNVFRAKRIDMDPDWTLGNSPGSGIALRTPDYKEEGPILVLLKSGKSVQNSTSANDLGYAHICFEADDLRGLVREIVKNGGTIVSIFPDPEKAPAIYAKDPDGNVFEIHFPFPTPLAPSTIYRSLDSLIRTNFKLSPPKTDRIRFLHVNINSKDWKKILSFYSKILDTSATGFERDYKGDFIENLTGVREAKVQGKHLLLPGYSEGGPTFEIFTYNNFSKRGPLDKSDIGRIAVGLRVFDLRSFVKKILQEGGTSLDEKGNTAILKDIEGNLLLVSSKKSNSEKSNP
ncbi:VOC family protein [Leptospira wolffii]|uniref:VOC family protein n=1 Tax=Leptospira wolffii TaxID=409998 RepID=UPI00108310E8|nr:VOC family protein [Leptospira wolffii]TGK55959.1 VOC family protein [Leptospira wolffii]TGK68379.1 VOC family protein [Leptospira wolffii]TGK72005.1 VOC family protein [Leptospira wolffii]TGL27582.1 VOC family protein [Leptospira wolffii]